MVLSQKCLSHHGKLAFFLIPIHISTYHWLLSVTAILVPIFNLLLVCHTMGALSTVILLFSKTFGLFETTQHNNDLRLNSIINTKVCFPTVSFFNSAECKLWQNTSTAITWDESFHEANEKYINWTASVFGGSGKVSFS